MIIMFGCHYKIPMYFDVKWSLKIFGHLKMFELCALDTKYQIEIVESLNNLC